jgi:HPr kinase/phosphorylase
MLIHATCIAIADKGVLLTGPPGSGKSDLALRMIEEGAKLVADDQCELRVEGNHLLASAPAAIVGLFEIRHVGLMQMPFVASAPLALYVELVGLEIKLERLPEAELIIFLERSLPRLRLPAFAASTPAKIRAALKM